jgi:hypothetical protein
LYSIDKENKTRSHRPNKQKEQKKSAALVKIIVRIKGKVRYYSELLHLISYQHLSVILLLSTSIFNKAGRLENNDIIDRYLKY